MIVLLIPAILFSLVAFIFAYNPDYGYVKAQESVFYHVYQPINKLDGRTITTKYITGKKLAGKDNAVQVFYDTPLEETINGKIMSIISINQVGVEAEFDFDKFSKELIKNPDSIKILNLQMATPNRAYLINKNKSIMATSLTIITADKVLITLISPKASSEELIHLAESLR